MTTVAPALVILAGGGGTRFWPASRRARPKQFLALTGPRTLLQGTVDRSAALVPPARTFVLLGAAYAELARAQLPGVQLLIEPEGRDTAGAVLWAALVVRHRFGPETVFGVLPADHAIGPDHEWQRAMRAAAAWAQEPGVIVTMGITPSFPATGYGYLEAGAPLAAGESSEFRVPSSELGDLRTATRHSEREAAAEGLPVFAVRRFREKPAPDEAARMLAAGGHYWNAGIFFHRADTILDEFARQAPDLVETLAPAADALGTPQADAALAACFPKLRRLSVDYAVMQGARRVLMLRPEFRWDDLGAWDALFAHLPAGEDGMVTHGRVLAVDAPGCLLWSTDEHLLAAVGVEGLIAVHTPDATLLARAGDSQAVKALVAALHARHPELL